MPGIGQAFVHGLGVVAGDVYLFAEPVGFRLDQATDLGRLFGTFRPATGNRAFLAERRTVDDCCHAVGADCAAQLTPTAVLESAGQLQRRIVQPVEEGLSGHFAGGAEIGSVGLPVTVACARPVRLVARLIQAAIEPVEPGQHFHALDIGHPLPDLLTERRQAIFIGAGGFEIGIAGCDPLAGDPPQGVVTGQFIDAVFIRLHERQPGEQRLLLGHRLYRFIAAGHVVKTGEGCCGLQHRLTCHNAVHQAVAVFGGGGLTVDGVAIAAAPAEGKGVCRVGKECAEQLLHLHRCTARRIDMQQRFAGLHQSLRQTTTRHRIQCLIGVVGLQRRRAGFCVWRRDHSLRLEMALETIRVGGAAGLTVLVVKGEQRLDAIGLGLFHQVAVDVIAGGNDVLAIRTGVVDQLPAGLDLCG
ncbi:hypothetical protein D3C73_593790 [compost metagenome]